MGFIAITDLDSVEDPLESGRLENAIVGEETHAAFRRTGSPRAVTEESEDSNSRRERRTSR